MRAAISLSIRATSSPAARARRLTPTASRTEAQLRGFAEATQNGKLSTTNLYIRLDADIALSDEPWTPIAKFGGKL